MSKKTFKTVEDALTHIEGLDQEIASLKTQLAEAQEIAKDAVEKANESASAIPGKVTVKVDGKKYHVRFGVDGLTKEDLAKDQAKLKELINKGSGAVKLLED